MTLPEKKHTGKAESDQFARFVETARALGCDEDKERFEKQLGKIAAHKPAKPDTKPQLEVGIFDGQLEIDDQVRHIMRENSHQLEEITKKSPC